MFSFKSQRCKDDRYCVLLRFGHHLNTCLQKRTKTQNNSGLRLKLRGPGITQSVWRLATGWTAPGDRVPAEAKSNANIQTSLLYNGYRVSFMGVKWPGHGVDHPPPMSSAEVEELVELYLYLPSGPSLPVLGWTLPLLYIGNAAVCKREGFVQELLTDNTLVTNDVSLCPTYVDGMRTPPNTATDSL